MAQPIWQTAAGSLGVIPEGVFYQQNLIAVDPDSNPITYSVIAGSLPAGVQCNNLGQIVGVPTAAVANIQGVPVSVNQDVTSKFVVRANSLGRIADRTFTLTITGNDVPKFTTPAGSLGSYYDGDGINIQIAFVDDDPEDTAVVSLASGELPPGLTVSPTGLIYGHIQPVTPLDQTPGYDETGVSVDPYDFVVNFVSRNYQFTLEVNDGKSSDLRVFTMFVYARNEMTADAGASDPLPPYATEPSWATADNAFITADETNNRAPFLTNSIPSNLGRIRSANKYAYQFVGTDYDTQDISYAINVNEGFGLPPGLDLDAGTGWLYGTIPDQGTTEVAYSFNIVVYQTTPIGTAVSCTATSSTNNRITCAATAPFVDPSDWYAVNPNPLYIPIKLSGTALGGLNINDNTIYYVLHVYSNTEFSIVANTNSTTAVTLTTSAGSMTASTIIASESYPFSLTIVGDIDSEITWLTDSDLGDIINGSTSLLRVEAVNRGNRELQYKLASGAFNSLPQGLQLLPSGDIAGRVTFNTFAIDLGATTFDSNTTTWDSNFVFTVNAYAPDTQQLLYNVSEIQVVNGGSGYNPSSPPTIVFETPIGASAVQAVAGNVTIVGNVITAVQVSNSGAGYTGVANVVITQGFGGSGANLQAVMQATGTRDVVSVYKTFNVRVIRDYNAPYQNLYVQAMPPENDRVLIQSLLSDENIFVPEYIFRPEDPNFGLSSQVTYQHAFGLAPDALAVYVESLYLNHYWKNLVLGQVETAVARDANDNIIYEVVYSKIIDNLTNDAGDSVSKIVNLPYAIIDPADGSTQLTQVYPNSLVNMRDQVIDTVGQISTGLPLWMTSKQTDGRVLGFTPAWVIAYVTPGNGNRIAYYLDSQFGQQLNKVDFKVDRYILDLALSANWDTATQDWTPQPSLTTFDRFNTSGYEFIGNVSIATNLAFSDVNSRTVGYINALGGLDGVISQINGDTIIFVKQENYNGPPGSSYSTTTAAWQDYNTIYDGGLYDQEPTLAQPTLITQEYDESVTVPGGYAVVCTATSAVTNAITCNTTSNMSAGDLIYFVGTAFGNLLPFVTGNQTYYVLDVIDSTHFRVTTSTSSTTPVTLTTSAGSLIGEFGNDRMDIWQISVDPVTTLVTLTHGRQTAPNQYVQISRGTEYRSAQLYRPLNPGVDLTRVSWLPLATVVTTETTFDQGSMEFIEPVDMYNPGDAYDKYLVFPKSNILV